MFIKQFYEHKIWVRSLFLFILFFSSAFTVYLNKSSEYINFNISGEFLLEQNISNSINLGIDLNEPENITVHKSNPSRKDIFLTMIDVGTKYNIPPEILYSIAFSESGLIQFNKKGTPFVSFDNGIGLMQITPGNNQRPFNIQKAKYDYKYNIEIGAKILLDKWNQQDQIIKLKGKKGNFLPVVGNKDPMILENWYFALWAYNGYAGENNPNVLPLLINKTGYFKATAYQDRVINLARKFLNIHITKIPKSQLPKRSIPDVGKSFPTPEPYHYSILHEKSFDNSDDVFALVKDSEGPEFQ